MSFILDALRKVEKGKHQEDELVELGDIISSEKGGVDKQSPSPVITVLFVFSLSLMVSWFVADKFTSIKVPPFPGIARKAKVVIPKPKMKGHLPNLPDKPKESVTDVDSMQAVIPQDNLPEVGEKKTEEKTAVTPFDAKMPKKLESKSTHRNNGGVVSEEIKEPYIPATAKALKPNPYYDEFDDYDEPTSTSMVLEGILYHKDVRKRTAMLRTRGGSATLAKVGGTYNGFRVTKIDMGKVTLLKDGQLLILKIE